MLRYFWAVMLATSIIIGFANHQINKLIESLSSLFYSITYLAFSLLIFLVIWTAILNIARELGWVEHVAKFLRPCVIRIFSSLPNTHPAIDNIVLNLAANILGMGNAATPAGLAAMRCMQEDNPEPSKATHAMCLLLAINTSSVQLIPASTIAVLAITGDPHPFSVLIPIWLTTSLTTLFAISLAKLFSCVKIKGIKNAANIS